MHTLATNGCNQSKLDSMYVAKGLFHTASNYVVGIDDDVNATLRLGFSNELVKAPPTSGTVLTAGDVLIQAQGLQLSNDVTSLGSSIRVSSGEFSNNAEWSSTIRFLTNGTVGFWIRGDDVVCYHDLVLYTGKRLLAVDAEGRSFEVMDSEGRLDYKKLKNRPTTASSEEDAQAALGLGSAGLILGLFGLGWAYKNQQGLLELTDVIKSLPNVNFPEQDPFEAGRGWRQLIGSAFQQLRHGGRIYGGNGGASGANYASVLTAE